MQGVLLAAVLNAETPAKDKAACARAWDILEDRKREIRGKPKLAPIKAPPKRPPQAEVAPVE